MSLLGTTLPPRFRLLAFRIRPKDVPREKIRGFGNADGAGEGKKSRGPNVLPEAALV